MGVGDAVDRDLLSDYWVIVLTVPESLAAGIRIRTSPPVVSRMLTNVLFIINRNVNRLLSVVRSRTDKIIELSRAALTVPRYGESNRLVGVD